MSDPKLSPHDIDAGTRMLLPWFPTMHLLLGVVLLVQDPHRSELATYRVAMEVSGGHMRLWSILFLLTAAVQISAVMTYSRRSFERGLMLGGWIAFFWGSTLLITAIRDQDASFVCCVWVVGWFVAHQAAAKSLREGRS